mmetsp:Transcript_67008/g.117481  ORF Transcript_67008/g.117481 Transcript_67008/m.117481 type:complete len:103 (+) Transcript_67008:1-309(+)
MRWKSFSTMMLYRNLRNIILVVAGPLLCIVKLVAPVCAAPYQQETDCCKKQQQHQHNQSSARLMPIQNWIDRAISYVRIESALAILRHTNSCNEVDQAPSEE